MAGRNEQAIEAVVGELVTGLGYAARVAEPADRGARLIMPSEVGG